MGPSRLFAHWLTWAELCTSTFVHVSYAAFVLIRAIVGDLMAAYWQFIGRLLLPFAILKTLWWSTSKVTSAVYDIPFSILTRTKSCLDMDNTFSSGGVRLSFLPGRSRCQDEVMHSGLSNNDESSELVRATPSHDTPIVLVPGIFGFGAEKMGNVSYWGGAEKRADRVFLPELGPLSSMHDRACELFYELKGGRVNFGKEHSQRYGHCQFGHTYSGLYPEWDKDHPVHFVGHSSGVQAVRLLHTMLDEKFFPEYPDTNAEWISSVTSLSGALNGTTRVYLDGISPKDGKSMRRVALLRVLVVGVLLYEWLDIAPLRKYYTFGFDHFRLHWWQMGITGLIKGLLNFRGPFATGDWIVPDLSIQSTVELNRRLKTYPNTFYFSYATRRTRRVLGRALPSSLRIHPLLFLRTIQIGCWRHPSTHPKPHESYRDEDWQENDGALNTISMLYPKLPEEHPHYPLNQVDLSESGAQKRELRLKPGIWYYTMLNVDHIHFIINRRRAGVKHDMLYDSIFRRCRKEFLRAAIGSLESSSCVCMDESESECHVP